MNTGREWLARGTHFAFNDGIQTRIYKPNGNGKYVEGISFVVLHFKSHVDTTHPLPLNNYTNSTSDPIAYNDLLSKY